MKCYFIRVMDAATSGVPYAALSGRIPKYLFFNRISFLQSIFLLPNVFLIPRRFSSKPYFFRNIFLLPNHI